MTALIAPPARAVADAPERPLPPMPPHWRSLARAFVHRARHAPPVAALPPAAAAGGEQPESAVPGAGDAPPMAASPARPRRPGAHKPPIRCRLLAFR